MTDDPEAMDTRSLVRGSAIAAVLAVLVLVVAILPAEYGLDPTGIGSAVGFTRLYEPAADPTVQTEGGDETVYAFTADWRLTRTPLAERDGRFQTNGESTRIVLPLNVTNLTTVTAHLAWSHAEGAEPHVYDVRVVAPDRRSSGFVTGTSTTNGTGNLTAQLNWRSVPFPDEGHPDGVLVPVAAPDRSGIGNWSFHVRLLRAGDAGDVQPSTWRLSVFAESYHLDVRRTSGADTDRVTLSLPAGSALEYKFRMEEGETLDYAWTSSGGVYWDLHAERTGAAADDTTSFATGTSSGDTGSHTAPFDGRHGWFWHNRGSTPVTITLETQGSYEIIGVT